MSNMKRRQRNNKDKNNYNDQKDVEAADDNDVGKHISTDFVKNQNTYLRLLWNCCNLYWIDIWNEHVV